MKPDLWIAKLISVPPENDYGTGFEYFERVSPLSDFLRPVLAALEIGHAHAKLLEERTRPFAERTADTYAESAETIMKEIQTLKDMGVKI